MLTSPKATALPWNLPKITPGTKVLFYSAPKRHKLCLLIVLNKLRFRRDRAKIIKKVGTIEIVTIAAPAVPSLRAPSQPLELTRLIPRLEIIVATTSKCVKKIGTWAGPLVTTVTRRAILPTNALSPTSQKTSIGLGNFLVGDWC